MEVAGLVRSPPPRSLLMNLENAALIVVDMQRYYLESSSAFAQFHTDMEPGCLDYIHQRCLETVIPNISKLISRFESAGLPILFLRLCGDAEDRSDLQRTFSKVHHQAAERGYPGLYPLRSEPHSEVISQFSSADTERTFCKTTYSAFTSAPSFDARLQSLGCQNLIFTGLATSQCVETTARDAADRDYQIIHVENAQADYSETTHRASLCSSQGVCGGQILDTGDVLGALAHNDSN
jgi:biuret amidohydrolase